MTAHMHVFVWFWSTGQHACRCGLTLVKYARGAA